MPLPTSLVVKNGSKARRQDVGRHAGTGVADRQHGVLAWRDLVLQPHHIVPGQRDVAGLDGEAAAGRHGIARVDAEVDQRGLDLRAVDIDRPEVGRGGGLHDDVLAERAPQQPAGACHEVVEVGDLGLQHLLARECQQLARQLRGLLAGVGDALRAFGDVRRHAVVVEDGVGIGQHDGQDVVEVVRHAAGELADRLHLLRLHELLAGAPVAARLLRHAPVEHHGDDGEQQDQRGDQGGDAREDRVIDRGAVRPGRGEAVGRGHRRVVHGGDGKAHDQRTDAVPDRAEAAEIELADDLAHLQRQDGEQDGDDDRGGEQRRVVAHQGVELHRHHAGVVHGADARAHQRAADQQAAGGDDRPGDDVQGHARAQDGGHDGQRGDPRDRRRPGSAGCGPACR